MTPPLDTKVPKSEWSVIDRLFFDIDYESYIKSELWLRKRAYFLRKHKACMLCGAKGMLYLHHRNYKNLGYETDKDITVVCNTCHWDIHKKQKAKAKWQKKIRKGFRKRV